MKADFKFKESIYLVSGEHELDLHNNYDFTGTTYSVKERRVVLSWRRCDRDGVPPSDPLSVEIEFLGVAQFQFLPRDSEKPFTEDDCLSSAGYWPDQDCGNSVIPIEAGPDQSWSRAFDFMSGATIVVNSDESRTTIK